MVSQIQNLKEIFGELFAKLMAFSLEEEFGESLGDSLVAFYNLQEGEEYEFNPPEEFLFLSWFLLDDTDSENLSLIDEFMKRNSDRLSLQEMQICRALKETHLTLMEVMNVKPGESLALRDVFLREEFETPESIGSDSVVKGSLLYSRVLPLGDSRFLVGAGIFLDASILEPLTQFVTEQYAMECEEGEMMTFRDFLKGNGELINWWIRAIEQGKPLESGTPDDKN